MMRKKNRKNRQRRGSRNQRFGTEGKEALYQSFAQDSTKHRAEILVNISDIVGAVDPGLKRTWQSYAIQAFLESVDYVSSMDLYLVIAEDGVTFTESDVVNTGSLNTVLDTCIDKNFSSIKIGTLNCDQVGFRPQAASEAKKYYTSKPKTFNLTKYLNGISRKLETGSGINFEAMIVGIATAANTTTVVLSGVKRTRFIDEVRTINGLGPLA